MTWNFQPSYLGTKASSLHYLQSIPYVPADFELITALALAAKTDVTNILNSFFKSQAIMQCVWRLEIKFIMLSYCFFFVVFPSAQVLSNIKVINFHFYELQTLCIIA